MSDNWKTVLSQYAEVTTNNLETARKVENSQEVTVLAHELWKARGCPPGTPDEDWFKAERQIAASTITDETEIGSRHFDKESIAHEDEGDPTAPRFPGRSELAQAPNAKLQRASAQA
jgi:Protein of unknown function (DUF2934)